MILNDVRHVDVLDHITKSRQPHQADFIRVRRTVVFVRSFTYLQVHQRVYEDVEGRAAGDTSILLLLILKRRAVHETLAQLRHVPGRPGAGTHAALFHFFQPCNRSTAC